MDEARIRELIGQLTDPAKPQRTQAAELLLAMGEGAVPYLEPLLHPEGDEDVAQYAVWILEQLATPEAEALLEAYWNQPL